MIAIGNFLWKQQNWIVNTARTLFWEEEAILVVSDLHIGKTGHFRKSGIHVPQQVFIEDLQKLFEAIHFFKPQKIIFTGDLFHSTANKELELFAKWRNDFASIPFVLVKGNHDILSNTQYQAMNILVEQNTLQIKNIVFAHGDKPLQALQNEAEGYIVGHVHPVYALKGLGRQHLKFPCYCFTEDQLIMPAFSVFTGGAIIKQADNQVVYIISKDEVAMV
jgi:uncharacterized protein